MQAMSHDAYRREKSLEQWVEQSGAGRTAIRSDVYDEQEDQWALLSHEVEGANMKRWDDRGSAEWGPRNTDGDTSDATHPFGDQLEDQQVDIVVAGVGGGGMNAVNRMINTRVRGVRFIAMNTDAQVLTLSPAPVRICLGQHHTKGLGAGGNAVVGMHAATESTDEIRAALSNADLVFIAAGMGGGTGTGAAPIVASIAKKLGALTVGIVTLPFSFEGSRRRRVAMEGISELSSEVDALITVPNDRLLSTVGREHSLSDAFKFADDVLRQGVQGIAEVINVPGMVNVDFADVRSVLREAGTALMSIGQGQGRNRAQRAAEEAIAGGFLNVTIRGAKRVLFNISGGEDMTLFEVNEVAERIGQAIDDSADIIFGAVIDPALNDTIRVTLIAAGMEEMHTMRLQAMRPDQLPGQQPRPRPVGAAGQQPLERERLPAAGTPTPRTASPTPEKSGTGGSQGTPQPSGPFQIPGRSATPSQPQRQQRSLNDLRGIRSMGHRQDRRPHYPDDDDNIDVPPFLKR
jgi:cell division protein FtsZ